MTCVLGALLAGGCAGELDNPERFATCPPGYVEQLFQQRCAGTCHAGSNPEAGLDLSTGDPGAMIGAVSETSFCQGRVLIDPEADDPMDHLLIDKLAERTTCGSRMPFGAEALTASELECVRRWVDESLGVAP